MNRYVITLVIFMALSGSPFATMSQDPGEGDLAGPSGHASR